MQTTYDLELSTLAALARRHGGRLERVETIGGRICVETIAGPGLDLDLHGSGWRLDWRVFRRCQVSRQVMP